MLGCLIGLIAFFLPRVAIVLLVIFSDWIGTAFKALQPPFLTWLVPLAGLIFMPYTLLAYVLAWHNTVGVGGGGGGSVGGLWLILIGVAVLLDLGVIGRGASSRRKKA